MPRKTNRAHRNHGQLQQGTVVQQVEPVLREDPMQTVEPVKQQHLNKLPLALSVSTRGVGFAVLEFMGDAFFEILRGDSDSDSCSDAEERISHGYDIYLTYRLWLALFEKKLDRCMRDISIDRCLLSPFMSRDTLIRPEIFNDRYPKHITNIINALGIVDHGDHTFVPVVARELKDNEGRFVPQSGSVLYSNLRKTVEALANVETPEQYRIDFEQRCPIPGAIWEHHLLVNPDEIIPAGHKVELDLYKFNLGLAKGLRGTLNKENKGSISMLVSYSTRQFRCSLRERNQTIEAYVKGTRSSFVQNYGIDDKMYTSFVQLEPNEVKEGLTMLLGEMPENCSSLILATREKYVCAFNLSLVFCQPICLTLSVTSRGIGFHLGMFFEDLICTRLPVPNIYATYRAFLGLFEMQLKPFWKSTRVETRAIYRSDFIHCNPKFIPTRSISVPDPINRIINSLGNIQIGRRTFVMAMAAEQLDKNGKLIPEPQNILLSNLRRTAEALADPETPSHHREHFERHCPIPGAIWDNHVLQNADEIIPVNYTANDLEADIFAWMDCASQLAGRSRCPLTELTISDQNIGKRSAFVSTAMIHPLKIQAREIGQELSNYVPKFEPQYQMEYSSFVCLTPKEAAEGQMILLGERPENEVRSIYALRNRNVCSYMLKSTRAGAITDCYN